MRIIKEWLLIALYRWFCFSLICSFMVAVSDKCDKTYPINYVFYSKLFCEVKGGEQ